MIRIRLRSKSNVMKVYDKESSVYFSKRFLSDGGKYIDAKEKTLLAKYVKESFFLEVDTAIELIALVTLVYLQAYFWLSIMRVTPV